MITSSEFFKKTFFEVQINASIEVSKSKKIPHKNPTNKSSLKRYSQLNHSQHKNTQNFSTFKNKQKNFSSLSHTKSQLNQNYNQIQLQNWQKRKLNHKELEQLTIDVTPWNQQSSLTSRQMYDTKQNLNKERQKIKSTISKYKFTRTIEQNDQEHANFIKSPKRNKKINFIVYEYGNKKSKESTRKQINLIKSIDLNKSYEQYLNHEIEFDKEFLFKSHTKVKTHNKQQLLSSKNNLSREGKNHSLMQKSPSKQFMDDAIEKDLVCSQLKDEHKHQKLDTCQSNHSNKEVESNCRTGKLTQRKMILDKGKILKFEINRKIYKGINTSINGIVPLINTNPINQRQKISLQVSGNKTRKLQYSFLSR